MSIKAVSSIQSARELVAEVISDSSKVNNILLLKKVREENEALIDLIMSKWYC